MKLWVLCPCPVCRSNGQVVLRDIDGAMKRVVNCRSCDGEGFFRLYLESGALVTFTGRAAGLSYRRLTNKTWRTLLYHAKDQETIDALTRLRNHPKSTRLTKADHP